jgi:uncharacterized protein
MAATSGRIGRVVINEPGLPPVVRPVSYVFDERSQSVVFRSALGSKLTRILDSEMAVFEIDGGDPVERTGWSVIIVGRPEEVTDRAEIGRLEDLELEPWAPGAKTHWVRIPTHQRPAVASFAHSTPRLATAIPAFASWSCQQICKPRIVSLRRRARCWYRGVSLCDPRLRMRSSGVR